MSAQIFDLSCEVNREKHHGRPRSIQCLVRGQDVGPIRFDEAAALRTWVAS